MKLAKPSEQDLNGVVHLLSLLHSVDQGFWPLPEIKDESINTEQECKPFDEQNYDDLKVFHDQIMKIWSYPPSGLLRCFASIIAIFEPLNRIIDPNETHLTTHPRIDKPEKAVLHLIERLQTDPRLHYLISPDTQSWRELTEAAAAIKCEPLEDFQEQLLKSIQKNISKGE